MSDIIRVGISQNGVECPAALAHDKAIWSGMSWGAAEVPAAALKPGPVTVKVSTSEEKATGLRVEAYAVRYE